jgi:hypothetical protein
MGLVPPAEDAMSDQVDETQNLTGGQISPDEKQDDLFPVSGTESEPTIGAHYCNHSIQWQHTTRVQID